MTNQGLYSKLLKSKHNVYQSFSVGGNSKTLILDKPFRSQYLVFQFYCETVEITYIGKNTSISKLLYSGVVDDFEYKKLAPYLAAISRG